MLVCEDMMLKYSRPVIARGMSKPHYSRVYLDKYRVSPYDKFRVENMLY
jgi:hypothetical protein